MKFNRESVAAIGEASGMVKLTSGKITTPVVGVNVPLPGGYDEFRLSIRGIFFATEDILGFAFSQNGGASFINDIINSDSYFVCNTGMDQAINQPSGTVGAFTYVNALMDPGPTTGGLASSGGIATVTDIAIYPGSETELAHIFGTMNNVGSHSNYGLAMFDCGLNAGAIVPPTKTRITNIWFQPDGNFDVPPTSSNRLAAGSYTLYGVPAL